MPERPVWQISVMTIENNILLVWKIREISLAKNPGTHIYRPPPRNNIDSKNSPLSYFP